MILEGVAAALLLGNVLVYAVVWRKNRPPKEEEPAVCEDESVFSALETTGNGGQNASWQAPALQSHSQAYGVPAHNGHSEAISSQFQTLHGRIEGLQSRIFGVEQSILRLKTDKPAQNGTGEMEKKLERLDEFRREYIIEVEAMKDMLKMLRIRPKEIYKTTAKEDKELDDKIRKLVFNSHTVQRRR